MNFELTPRRMKVLTALAKEPGGEIQDSDGQATALLMVETGHRTTNALSGVLQQLEMAGLVERDVSGGRRTYRIALTRKGREVLAQQADQPVETAPLPPTVPAAVLDGAVDLDLLAGVLLKKALLATKAQEESAAAKDAEARAEIAEAEVRELRAELAELRAQVKTLEHNNQVLAASIDKVKKSPGLPIKELISKREAAELEKLMRQLPTARG